MCINVLYARMNAYFYVCVDGLQFGYRRLDHYDGMVDNKMIIVVLNYSIQLYVSYNNNSSIFIDFVQKY